MIHQLERIYAKTAETFPSPLEPPAMEGFMGALLCSDKPVNPAVWLPYIYQDNSGTREFSEQSALHVQKLILNYMQDLSLRIFGEDFSLYLRDGVSDREEGLKKWCEGFLIGLSLLPVPGKEPKKQNYFIILTPFMVAMNKEVRTEALASQSEYKEEEELLEDAVKSFPSALNQLRALMMSEESN